MKNISYFTLIALILMSASCKQEGFVTTDTGLQYMYHIKNDGAKPEIGDILQIRLTYYTAGDSLIFDSKQMQDTFLLSMEEPSFMGSVEEGLIEMSRGDSITMLVSADSVFEKTLNQAMPEFIEKGSKLRFHVKMYDFETYDEYLAKQKERERKIIESDQRALQQYISDNNITVEPTESGLYFVEQEPGSGIFIGVGDEVTVDYTGTFLDGTVFDSSVGKEPKPTFTAGEGKVIPGWDEALLRMKKGAKAKIIVPSNLAYGARGYPGLIPPHKSLIFEMHVLNLQ